MAKFKDKSSGSVIEFHEEHDIQAMRVHPDYDEVKEQAVDNIKEEVKKVGRPKKESE